MKTYLTGSTAEAARFIKNGGIVAFPTETVYGLGADIFNEAAIGKVFAAKGRPNDNPLIAHIGNFGQIAALVSDITPSAEKFIAAFFPGPLTIVLPKADKVTMAATAGLATVGVRMPRHETAREFIERCATPLVAPSANLSGKPSPTNWEAVLEDLRGRIECILQGEVSEIGLESTVVDCTGEIPLVLRTGAVTLEDLQRIVPATSVYRLKKDEQPKSPGLKHRHYSPQAKVFIVKSLGGQRGIIPNAGFIGLHEPLEEFELTKICGTVEEYARSVFDFFRRCDRAGLDTIICQAVEEKGIGLALMDRLRRASEK
jgi:L-threonylcarbamoyladenylate synthase